MGAGAIASAPTTANATARRRKSLAGAALSLSGEIMSTITIIDEEGHDGDNIGLSATTTAASVTASNGGSVPDNDGSSSGNNSVPKGGWVYSGPSFDRFENLDVVSAYSDISILREQYFFYKDYISKRIRRDAVEVNIQWFKQSLCLARYSS